MKWGRAVFWLVVVATLIALVIHLTRDSRSHNAQIAQLKKERMELRAIIKRITGRTQEAQLVVVGQVLSRRGRVMQTTLLWREFTFTTQGRVALPLQKIVIPGNEPYIGGYVLKFADSFVEAGNALRGKSLGFFTRIFSNSQAPDRGTSLLGREGVPRVLEPRYGPPNPFALSLWRQIQRLIRSRRADKKLGLQVVQLQYVAKPVRPGVLYTIYLQNNGGLEFVAEPGHNSLIDRLLHQSSLPGQK